MRIESAVLAHLGSLPSRVGSAIVRHLDLVTVALRKLPDAAEDRCVVASLRPRGAEPRRIVEHQLDLLDRHEDKALQEARAQGDLLERDHPEDHHRESREHLDNHEQGQAGTYGYAKATHHQANLGRPLQDANGNERQSSRDSFDPRAQAEVLRGMRRRDMHTLCAAFLCGCSGISGAASLEGASPTPIGDSGATPIGTVDGGSGPSGDGAAGHDGATGGGASAGSAGDGGASGSDGGGAPASSAMCPGPLGTRTPVNISGAGSMQNPSFSPDSTRLLFTNFIGGYDLGTSSVGVVSVAGGSPTTLLPSVAESVDLPGCWNAALNQIVVSSDMGGDLDQIYRLDPSGKGSPQIVATPGMGARQPSLSPDGQWVVFEGHSPSAGDNDPGRIWKVKSDGTQATQLTPDAIDAKQPNWSPTADRILYQAIGEGGGTDIFTIDPSGGSLVNVTMGGQSENTGGSWSPDGSSIVYSSDLSADSLSSLYVIAATGGTPGARHLRPHLRRRSLVVAGRPLHCVRDVEPGSGRFARLDDRRRTGALTARAVNAAAAHVATTAIPRTAIARTPSGSRPRKLRRLGRTSVMT